MSEEIHQPEVQNLEEPSSELEVYSKEVINEMISQNIPPTPSNFDAYFDKMLESKPIDLKNEILKILELEKNKDTEQHIRVEQHLKKAFLNVKNFMTQVKQFYKNLGLLSSFIEKQKREINSIEKKEEIENILDELEKKINTLSEIIKNRSIVIKKDYEVIGKHTREIQDLTIYDSRLDIYKKNYFINKLKIETKLIKEFHHESTILMIKINYNTLKNVKSKKVKFLINRNIAKTLTKTSRRSDLIAMYDDGIFSILMRHTSIQNAQKAAERLKDIICNTNFFIGEDEISLDINIGLARIDLERPIETTLICALDAIALGEKENLPYGVCPEDIEQSQVTLEH